MKILAILFFSASLGALSYAHDPEFHHHSGFITPPEGQEQIGDSHGEIGVDAAGNIYVSVTGGPTAGIQIYSPEGKFLRNLPNARKNHHGFTIVAEGDQEFIYAACLRDPQTAALKLSLDGEVILSIPNTAIPKEEWIVKKKGANPSLALTHIDVASNGDIYLVDGYASDKIFVFDSKGVYQKRVGGKEAPHSFKNAHKMAIDPRFEPNRILVCDRANDRLVHLDLDGNLIGEVETGLRRPSAVDFHGDLVCVAEIKGRVTVLDKQGKIVAEMGTNDVAKEISTSKTPPTAWRDGVVTSPHGITFDGKGNILMTEWNKWGRILRWDLKRQMP